MTFPQPPSPQVEVSLSEDFEVPPIDDEPTTEIATVGPPPRPRSVPPPPPPTAPRPPVIPPPPAPVEAQSRAMMRTVPDLPAVQITEEPGAHTTTVAASEHPVAHVHPHPHPQPPPGSPDDESVEISLEDAAELLSDSRNSDPSLALLDALAELPPDAPVPEEPKAPLKTTPPPPEAATRPPKPPLGAPPAPAGGPQSINPRATAVTVPDRNKRRKLWWEELFGDDYLRTMEKSSAAQTQAEADWIEQALGVESGVSILDVACGVGRQSSALSKRGYEVVGLDYSLSMLTRAAEVSQEQGAKVTFMRADMCTMEFSEVFDAAYCVGTSFGYFDDEKNAEVARKIHRALKPHGTFRGSVVNRYDVIQRQPGMAWFEGDGCVCMEETTFNFITSRLNVKRTVIFEDGRQRETEYSIRLYSLHELGQVLHAAGFRILEVSGNARTPSAFGPSSRELIILAQKRGPEVVEIAGLATAPYDTHIDAPEELTKHAARRGRRLPAQPLELIGVRARQREHLALAHADEPGAVAARRGAVVHRARSGEARRGDLRRAAPVVGARVRPGCVCRGCVCRACVRPGCVRRARVGAGAAVCAAQIEHALHEVHPVHRAAGDAPSGRWPPAPRCPAPVARGTHR